ncbi:unnamed protein product [Ostreobium quekettii]|uniref:Uncharacterized protein n=1 Tax=Ostreobium quekettii TaxID=121088 RepID=A0A8S1JI90_9CHLO|nr:unnamed protein product [Ostreobium quekettii]|eukprot:evm.model.scf_441EXC.8 EVM.evm.TU.scf_441EXC.8   scf_441EXC:40904-42373(-)
MVACEDACPNIADVACLFVFGCWGRLLQLGAAVLGAFITGYKTCKAGCKCTFRLARMSTRAACRGAKCLLRFTITHLCTARHKTSGTPNGNKEDYTDLPTVQYSYVIKALPKQEPPQYRNIQGLGSSYQAAHIPMGDIEQIGAFRIYEHHPSRAGIQVAGGQGAPFDHTSYPARASQKMQEHLAGP